MADVLVKLHVEDFDRWKGYFDGLADDRMVHGSRGYSLFDVSGDTNELVLLFDLDSAENARAFFESPEGCEAIQPAGVASEREIDYIEEIESKSPEQPMA